MTDVRESHLIAGVKIATLTAHADERGQFLETFRKEWFPERAWDSVQGNRSDSRAGVLRGLHYHFHQIDYWVPLAGRLRVGLADLRRGSPTRGRTQVLELDAESPVGVFIPVGVAHGFYAITDAILTYLVDNYYDGADELGVRWDDPALGVAWDVRHPILSPRDRANPSLADIPEDRLPE